MVHIFSLLFMGIFLPFPSISQANFKDPKGEKPKTPFDFIKHLQGYHKGDKVEGLHDLKNYLENFGYLNYHHSNYHTDRSNDNDFDDLLESAIKTYQLNYNLNATGVLDAHTVTKMMMPRCGVPDIINGTSWMQSGKKSQQHKHHVKLHTVSHFKFFDGKLRWPAGKTHLTYGFLPGTRPATVKAVARAFGQWSSATHFTFARTNNYAKADIKISFQRLDHGDGSPFDGRGGILAHASAPTDGTFHLDADELWSIGPVVGAFDLETVALHEIGHLLGLGHSSVKDAIMWPDAPSGVTKGLHKDDIQGIKALYNVRGN